MAAVLGAARERALAPFRCRATNPSPATSELVRRAALCPKDGAWPLHGLCRASASATMILEPVMISSGIDDRPTDRLFGPDRPLWDLQVSLEQKMTPVLEVGQAAMPGTPISASSVTRALASASARVKYGHSARVYRPTVIPPRAWTAEERGGYWTLDTFYPRCQPHSVGLAGRSDIVAAAVNYLQAVPWRINQRVLAVVSEAMRLRLKIPGLPQAGSSGLEPSMVTPELDEQWQYREIVTTAYEYAEFDRFYFPYALSLLEGFTTIPRQLQPHGSDLARSLLEFADARALTQPQPKSGEGSNNGHQWLARHLSACFDSLPGGINPACTWVFEREGLLRQIAANPFEHCAWVEASKPWQALAAVFEWVDYLNVGHGFESHLPVSTAFHPRWQLRSSPHPERHLAAINAAQASGIALTGLTSKLLATHAADAGQAMSILDGAEEVGVQAERQELLKEARRLAKRLGSAKSTAKVEAHGAPSANHQADRTEQQ